MQKFPHLKYSHLCLHTCVERFWHLHTCQPRVDGRLLAVLSVMSAHATVVAGHVVGLLHVGSARHHANRRKDRWVKATEGGQLRQTVSRL